MTEEVNGLLSLSPMQLSVGLVLLVVIIVLARLLSEAMKGMLPSKFGGTKGGIPALVCPMANSETISKIDDIHRLVTVLDDEERPKVHFQGKRVSREHEAAMKVSREIVAQLLLAGKTQEGTVEVIKDFRTEIRLSLASIQENIIEVKGDLL